MFNDDGLGQAMAESGARDATNRLEAASKSHARIILDHSRQMDRAYEYIAILERRIEALEQLLGI